MKGLEYEKRIREEGVVTADLLEIAEDDDEAAFGIRVSLPGISVSVVDNGDPSSHGREIMLAGFEKIYASFSQSREGYHEFELRLMSFQVDNFVQKSIHPVLVRRQACSFALCLIQLSRSPLLLITLHFVPGFAADLLPANS